MKRKYGYFLLLSIAFIQSLVAGGLPKRPGSLMGVAEALHHVYYLMHGTTEFPDPEGDDDDSDDSETELEEEDPESLEDKSPIYLIGENRDNEVDLAFQGLMVRLALEGKIILVHENKTFSASNCTRCIPTLVPQPAHIATPLLPVIQSCWRARKLLLNNGDVDALLNSITEVVLAIINPETPELETVIQSFSQNEDLLNNHVYQWIEKNADTVLKKQPEKHAEVIKKTWSKAINNRKPKTVKNLRQLLELTLLELLQSDTEIFSILEAQPESAFQALDAWDDVIIAHYLQTCYDESGSRPIVFIGDIATIRRGIIESILHKLGAPTTRRLEGLPINENIKEAKQRRIDEGYFETPLDVLSPRVFNHPVYLIGEVHDQYIDTLFVGCVIRAEKKGLLIHGRESRFYYENNSTHDLNTHGLEGELALTLCNIHMLTVLLNDVDSSSADEILGGLSCTLASMASATDPLLLKALDNAVEDDDWLLSWLKRNKSKLLKKDFEDQMCAIKKAFEKTIKTKNKKHINSLKAVLESIKASILEVQKELPESQQLSEEQLSLLRNPYANQLSNIALWRDIFIAQNIVKLHAKAESRNIPLVVILGASHIENIQNKLEEQGIPTSSNVLELPLAGPDETPNRLDCIKSIKEQKQYRIDHEIKKEMEEIEALAERL